MIPARVHPPIPTPSAMRRSRADGLTMSVCEAGVIRELQLTVQPDADTGLDDWLRPLAAALHEHEATVVRHEVFGRLDARASVIEAWRRQMGAVDWPMTWVDSPGAMPVAGMHLHAVAGADVETIRLHGRAVGRTFNDGQTQHCMLGEILPDDASVSREQQARRVFELIEAEIHRAGLAMTDVARTWLFLDDILAWYEPFNEVRRRFFAERGIFTAVMPASTGVGARNPAGVAVVASVWAARALDGRPAGHEVLSPLQCPAPNYGSCFSRAVEICTGNWRRVLVSGTASIAPGGASVCAGDMDGQIDLTLQVVRAILVSRGMDYADVTRATAYLRHPADRAVWQRWVQRLGLEGWPLITTNAVVCRDELLFEIELDAMAPIG